MSYQRLHVIVDFAENDNTIVRRILLNESQENSHVQDSLLKTCLHFVIRLKKEIWYLTKYICATTALRSVNETVNMKCSIKAKNSRTKTAKTLRRNR